MKTKAIFASLFTLLIAAVLLVGEALPAAAQAQTGSIHGSVIDPSGAMIPSATVVLSSKSASSRSVTCGADGTFVIDKLEPGRYTISATAQGFAPFDPVEVLVFANRTAFQKISLRIATATQSVTVSESSIDVDTSADNNASSTVIKAKDLDALSDDPDELQSELSALAGGAAGPNGGEMYIDGFSGGSLPPKSSIREIRINQNPFAAQYDKLGYGRIEILTKPGTDKLHGSFMMMGNHSSFNSLNPFVTSEPAYYTTFMMGNAGGALTKTSSWFGSLFRRDNQSNSIINATRLDSAGNQYNYSAAVANPQTRLDISPRLDFQFGAKNTLSARYSFSRETQTNSGASLLALESQAYNLSSTQNSLQLSDTQVLSDHVVNETRFQFASARSNQSAVSSDPAESVPGAFTGGGNSIGANRDNQNNFELQNSTMISSGAHSIDFGTRLRFTRDSSYSTSGFNGQFTYTSLDAYKAHTPSEYDVTAGAGAAAVNYFDAGVFFQDDYKWRPNLTVSYGLRYESQNRIGDHADLAPRLSFAWAPGARGGKTAKTVIRGGYGWFYDRFGETNVLQTIRHNGVTQQQYVVKNPSFYPGGSIPIPTAATLATLSTSAPTIYTIAPNFKAAVNMQAALGVEHQFGKVATLSATFMNSHGVHQPYTDNINAFIPSTYNATTGTGTRPNGINENIYQYQSGGVYNQNQLTLNYTVKAKRLSLFGFYMLNYAKADTSGSSYFPSSQTNPSADYGRAAFDVRNRFLLGGNIQGPFGISINPMLDAVSGSPFNITIGQDLNGDNQFNDRPALATASSTNTMTTAYGTFDLSPAWNATRIPYNVGTGPAQFSMNMRVSKSIGIGPRVTGASATSSGGPGGPPPGGGPGGGGPGSGLGPGGLSGSGGPPRLDQPAARRYSLNFAAMSRNVFNHVNLAAPVGVLNSPKFGQSNSLAGGFFSSAASNRSIDLQVSFNF